MISHRRTDLTAPKLRRPCQYSRKMSEGIGLIKFPGLIGVAAVLLFPTLGLAQTRSRYPVDIIAGPAPQAVVVGGQMPTNKNPAPRHCEQSLLRSNPVASQDGHSFQSAMFVALRFAPWQRSPPIVLLHRPFATEALYPVAPHSVQHVFGSSLFRAR